MTFLARILAVLALGVALSNPALARNAEPLVNHDNVSWMRADGRALDIPAVREQIVQAAQSKGWTVAPGTAENTLIATLVVRNKHSMRVTVGYGAGAFSVKYLDSINMKHGVEEAEGGGKNQEVIHPNYNKWVQDLVNTIRQRLTN